MSDCIFYVTVINDASTPLYLSSTNKYNGNSTSMVPENQQRTIRVSKEYDMQDPAVNPSFIQINHTLPNVNNDDFNRVQATLSMAILLDPDGGCSTTEDYYVTRSPEMQAVLYKTAGQNYTLRVSRNNISEGIPMDRPRPYQIWLLIILAALATFLTLVPFISPYKVKSS